jgi:hypothetical protein
LVVTRLHDPAARGTFRSIVEVCLPKEVQEELLHKIFGFRGIVENFLSDAVHQAAIPTEKKAEGLFIFSTQPTKKGLIGKLLGWCNRVLT